MACRSLERGEEARQNLEKEMRLVSLFRRNYSLNALAFPPAR